MPNGRSPANRRRFAGTGQGRRFAGGLSRHGTVQGCSRWPPSASRRGGEPGPHRRIVALGLAPHDLAAVGRRDQADHVETAVRVDGGVGPDRQLAPAAEMGQERPLGVDPAPARRVLDGRARPPGWRRRRRGIRWPGRPDRPGAPSSDTSNTSARRSASPTHVAPATATTTASTSASAARAMRVGMLPRRPTKRRSGRRWASWVRRRVEPVAMVAPSRQRGQRHAGQRVARVGPLGHARQHEALGRPRRRQVLGRVHGHVGPALEHGVLHLLGEHALAADLPDRPVAHPVARGLDRAPAPPGGPRPP